MFMMGMSDSQACSHCIANVPDNYLNTVWQRAPVKKFWHLETIFQHRLAQRSYPFFVPLRRSYQYHLRLLGFALFVLFFSPCVFSFSVWLLA